MKQIIWENGVKVGEIDVPDSPGPTGPMVQSKTEFLAWFDATFGANATPTRTQLANAWPVQ